MSPQHLLRFLYLEAVEATDNRAERMLRPAVISADSQSPTQDGRLQQNAARRSRPRRSGASPRDLSPHRETKLELYPTAGAWWGRTASNQIPQGHSSTLTSIR